MTYSFRTNGDYIDLVHIDDTSLMVETVLISLHHNSRSVEWSLLEDTSEISFKSGKQSFDNVPITEIDFDGVAMDSQDDFETGITAMFPGLAGGGEEGGISYLVYSANMNQSGTSAPAATVMNASESNYLGDIVWSYSDVGDYLGALNGAFTGFKTWCLISGGDGVTFKLSRVNGNQIEIQCFNTAGSFSNDLLTDISIEIRVYP